MIVPSIDLMDGRAVQLVRGREKVLDAGDPRPIAERFGRVGEVAVIDLDAALGRGSNEAVIRELLGLAPCRVGGGIRTVESARRWLDAGARRVILGTAATPDVLSQLPRDRVIAALDSVDGDVVTHGWRTRTGARLTDALRRLAPCVGGFLVTFVESEGTMCGLDPRRARDLAALVPDVRLTVAGGVAAAAEVGDLDRLGIDAQIGMALYTGCFDTADAITACLTTDRPDGLWPTVVTDEMGVALGLAYSSLGSLRLALDRGEGVYHSRRRGLWRKGETSGAVQRLLGVALDCDRDTLRFMVRQHGGFCHSGARTCWGEDSGLFALARRLAVPSQDAASYTQRLRQEPDLLAAKLIEEAGELGAATEIGSITHEAADLLFFAVTRLAHAGVDLSAVSRELDRRALRLTRRAGDAKPGTTA